MKRLFALLLLSCVPMLAQVPICPAGFAASSSSGICGTTFNGGGQPFNVVGNDPGIGLSGNSVILQSSGVSHRPAAMTWQTKVNVQAFTWTTTFVPNNDNVSMALTNNSSYCGSFAGGPAGNCNPPPNFFAGAGCEGNFFQAFPSPNTTAYPSWPNNTMAVELDNWSFNNSSETFGGSTAQLYGPSQSPCNPNDSGPYYWLTNKILTSPVQLNTPATTQGSPSSDTFSATLTYAGGNLTLTLFDVTAGGSCPGASCFTQTWSGVNIPSEVNGNTAYLTILGATGIASTTPLLIKSTTYTVTTPPSTPPVSTYTSASSSGSPFVATPTLSPVAGSYSGTQTVTPSSSTSGAYFCYILSATTPTLFPQTDNAGACTVGTLYSSPISVSSSQTLYLMGGVILNKSGGGGAATNGMLHSNLVVASYVIGGTSSPTNLNGVVVSGSTIQ